MPPATTASAFRTRVASSGSRAPRQSDHAEAVELLDERDLAALLPARLLDPVAANDIRRWAQAMQNPNPLYYDAAIAAESHFGQIVAPQSFAVATDVNNDGRLDLVAADRFSNTSQSGTVSVLLGDGHGGFVAASSGPFPVSPAAGNRSAADEGPTASRGDEGIVIFGSGTAGLIADLRSCGTADHVRRAARFLPHAQH